ncbi:MAG: metallophosphoesterase [Verrucomicrobia bacterium]|nr:metallophosphoesterase [Verrucomicrobiota bacterium]
MPAKNRTLAANLAFFPAARHFSLVTPDQRTWLQLLSRREFFLKSSAVAASLASAGAAMSAAEATDSAAVESPLFLPPLLSRPTGNSIHITALNGDQEAEACVELRREGANDWQRHPHAIKVSPRELLDWDVKELSPAIKYDYRISLKRGADENFRETAAGSFRTQRKGPASYTAVLITDSHTGSFAPGSGPVLTLDRVVQNAARVKGEFVLDLGDNTAWAGSREFPQKSPAGAIAAYAQYRRQIGPLSQHAPHFSVVGNWSGESGKFPDANIQITASVRRALLPGPNHLTYPQGGSEGEDYYAFSWGDVLYIVLNIQTYSKPSDPAKLKSLMSDVNRIEEWTLGEKQMAWFESKLQKATERFRFVCMHHPAGGNAGDPLNTEYGRGGARAANTGEQARIHSLMKKHKVQIFFYGHDHVFVDDVVDGIHYALPGSCGAPWKFTRAETGYERFWPDSGHAQLDVTPEKATVTYVNLEGKALHSFSVLPA